MIPESLRQQAVEAFRKYEAVVMERLLSRPGWRLAPEPLVAALDSNDPEIVTSFIQEVHRDTEDIQTATILRTPVI